LNITGKSLEIPGATFTIFPVIALTIWLPFYDRLLFPWLQKIRGADEGFTLLQRMGIGMVLSIIGMVVSGIIEAKRRYYAVHQTISKDLAYGGGGISSLSSFWLILPLIILGLAEAFNNVSQLEFYYKQFPENMQSIAGSLLFSGIAISSYLSGLLVAIVHSATSGYQKDSWLSEDLNKGRLDYFYYLIAAIGVLNFMYFLVLARWYRYKGMNDYSESQSGPILV
jgi:dipeptide/tripeptide permease